MFPFLEFAYEHVSKIAFSTLEKHRTWSCKLFNTCVLLSPRMPTFQLVVLITHLLLSTWRKLFHLIGIENVDGILIHFMVFLCWCCQAIKKKTSQATSSLVTLSSWGRIYGRNTTDIVTKCFRCSWHKHLSDHCIIYYYCFHRWNCMSCRVARKPVALLYCHFSFPNFSQWWWPLMRFIFKEA